RETALISLGKIDPERGAEAAKINLLGGTYHGKQISQDVAFIRAAALDVLEKAQPLSLHAIALQALRHETDPAIVAKLWNVEFGARREVDPARLQLEYEAVKERIEKRALPGL